MGRRVWSSREQKGVLGVRRVEASQEVGMGAPRVPCRNLETLIPIFISFFFNINERFA